MVKLSNKFYINIFLFIIIFLLVLYYINCNIYYENFSIISHEYEKVQLTEIDLEEFNILFNSYIVRLPTCIEAVGIDNGNIYILKAKNRHLLFQVYFKEIFIPFIMTYIYPHLNKEKLYFIVNLADGHGERLCFYKNFEYYMASKDEFENKQEITLRQDGKFPLLHARKYILASCKLKKDIYTKVIPDVYFIQSTGHRELIKSMIDLRKLIPWKNKENKGVWRGNVEYGTKCNFKQYTSELNQRQYFVQLINDGKLSNVNYSNIHLSKEEMCKYKYLLDIDGWSNTWDATIWKMLSGSVMLKVDGVWEQWYYPKLREWRHYIPINHDFSNLNEVLAWCSLNDDKCKEISNNAYEFVLNEVSFDKACQYTIEILNSHIV